MVLDALIWIKNSVDSTLTLRRSCRVERTEHRGLRRAGRLAVVDRQDVDAAVDLRLHHLDSPDQTGGRVRVFRQFGGRNVGQDVQLLGLEFRDLGLRRGEPGDVHEPHFLDVGLPESAGAAAVFGLRAYFYTPKDYAQE